MAMAAALAPLAGATDGPFLIALLWIAEAAVGE